MTGNLPSFILEGMKPYTLKVNTKIPRLGKYRGLSDFSIIISEKQIAAKSYLEALMEEVILLKQSGKNKFTIEASNKGQKLGIYVRA